MEYSKSQIQKISQGDPTGIAAFISLLQKQGHNLFDSLILANQGQFSF